MAVYKLSLIMNSPSSENEFLVVKQTRPPKFGEEEYDSFTDSDLWDLPSGDLNPLAEGSSSQFELQGIELCPDKLNLREYDFESALQKVVEQLYLQLDGNECWKFIKYVEEPAFGPGSPLQTVFISGQLSSSIITEPGACQWMSKQNCFDCLLDVKPGNYRMGPLVAVGLLNDSFSQSVKLDLPETMHSQEYPPGLVLVPMDSRTAKPFCTTNLVVFAPQNVPKKSDNEKIVACGDALIVDPGCLSHLHHELANIVAALPRKLIVFVTHHHFDHVDGLSVVMKSNPDAILVTHENTFHRIKKGDWSQDYTSVSGDEEIYVGGERLRVVFAPGHTDGHLGLFHLNTQSLIVGDHCVGQGSAVLDISAGGDMADYFSTTYKFIELSPRVIIPMHGRANLWPKHMLCSYLKNRRSREASILMAIQDGAKTLFDIVANVYASVDRSLWVQASWNVRLHVDHLAHQKKLPESFSVQKFQKSTGLPFLVKWLWEYSRTLCMPNSLVGNKKIRLPIAVVVASISALYLYQKKT